MPNKATGYNLNIQKGIIFQYIRNEHVGTKMLKIMVPLDKTYKNETSVNLTKHVKDV